MKKPKLVLGYVYRPYETNGSYGGGKYRHHALEVRMKRDWGVYGELFTVSQQADERSLSIWKSYGMKVSMSCDFGGCDSDKALDVLKKSKCLHWDGLRTLVKYLRRKVKAVRLEYNASEHCFQERKAKGVKSRW